MIEKWIEKRLIDDIGYKRYIHSVGVMETSVKLSKIYNCNTDKARMAGLLHDCGKLQDKKNYLKMIDDFDIILDNVMEHNTDLIHGPLGAKIAEKVYDVHDKEILSAIYYHTTGKENMSLLEKIVYIADYIEPNRDFEGVERVRELAFVDLNESLIQSMDNTIKYIVDKKILIHLDTIKARNYLILEKDSE
ncbi:MAG: HD domain-containing protein [Tissierellaceae bacterium]|jgi:predicted HD superfamily hydrolase involved in NAD metabolism|nr:HD domain-containing protein [Tissierellaceae bacterium]